MLKVQDKNLKLLSVKEVADILNVSAITVKRYIADEKIESIKVGGNRRIHPDALERFLDNANSKKAPKKIHRGSQFYWSQKSAEVAHKIYMDNCRPGDIVMDLFLGAGSSLYGSRGLGLRFIGVELNEQPLAITKFNIKSVDTELTDKLKQKIDLFESSLGGYYKYVDENGNTLTFDRVVYDRNEKNLLNVHKLICYDEVGNKVDVTGSTFIVEQYLNNYEKCGQYLQSLERVELIKNSRIAIKEDMVLSDIFSPINYVILNEIKKQISSDEDFKFLLGSVLHLTKLTDIRSQSQFPYWVPKTNILDRNIFTTLRKKLGQIKKQPIHLPISKYSDFESLNSAKEGCLLLNMPAQKLSEEDVPSNSIDFILTDPPYFDQVAYSEYLKIWEYFLGYKTNLTDEIVVSQRVSNTKDEAKYIEDIQSSFKQTYRVLKPGASMWVYFREARPEKIGIFLTIMQELGFLFNGIVHVSANKYTYKQNNSSDSTFKGDALYKFSKPDSETRKKISQLLSKKSGQDLTSVIKKYIHEYGSKHKEFSLGELLHDGLLELLYEEGLLEFVKNHKPILKVLHEICTYNEKRRTYGINNE